MDPHVYPDPQTAPLSLAAAMPTPTFTVIEQLTTPDPFNPAPAGDMHIRIALSGGVAPSVVLKVTLGPTTGDPVTLTALTQSIYKAPGTGLADYVADALVQAEPNNIYHVTILIADATQPYVWQLGIQNNDAAARQATWVVSGTLANTLQPWIDVTPVTLNWDVLVNGTAGESVQVNNRGTGPCTVTSVSPALPAGFTLDPLPVAVINPGSSAPITVHFTGPAAPPAPNGVTNATADVTTTPPDNTALLVAGHNKRISLAATTQALEVVMLLDDSGSMSWAPDGTILPPASPTARWSELASAVNPFLNTLAFIGENRGKFGVAKFPPTNPLDPNTFNIAAMATIPNVAGMATAQAAIAAVAPNNGTPMGDGMDHVFGNVATSFFASDATSIAANRRWLLLMTDGAENSGTHLSKEYILPPNGTAAAGTSLSDKRVELFAVGYGITGHSDVNPTLLSQLAAGSLSGGEVRRPDDAGLTATQVAQAFQDAIKAGITPASSPGDPPAVFRAGQAEARFFVNLSHYDGRSIFVINWNTPDARRLRLELITPTCDIITPETAGQGTLADVIFRGGDRFNQYMVGTDFLQNKADPAHPRYGTWTLRVTSPALSDIRQGLENYIWEVIVDSQLRMTLDTDRTQYFAGDPITVSARLTAAGRPITGASVVMSTTAPTMAEANWIAGLSVPAAFIEKARSLVNGDSTEILVKKVAAGLAQLNFPGGSRNSNIGMLDPDNIGTYSAAYSDTSTPEVYTFYVTAVGVTDDGVNFRREGKVVVNVLVQPDPRFTRVNVVFLQNGVAQAIVTPLDRFGNVYLTDPRTTNFLSLQISGGDPGTALTSTLDGSYTQTIKHSGAAFNLLLTAGGKTVSRVTTPAVAKLTYVNLVLAYQPGAEAAKGANRHTDPKAMLGDPTKKTPDTFVALGAGGSIVVAIDKNAILDTGGNDITVFVPPNTDPCAYKVEAYVPPPVTTIVLVPGKWVLIGTSSGGTQSFDLAAAKIAATPAIRITDLSRRTRGIDLKPLNGPGACLIGVGVVRVSTKIPWGLQWLLNFMKNLPK